MANKHYWAELEPEKVHVVDGVEVLKVDVKLTASARASYAGCEAHEDTFEFEAGTPMAEVESEMNDAVLELACNVAEWGWGFDAE